MKGLPKTKRCNSVAFTVSVRIRCICETALTSTIGQMYTSTCIHVHSWNAEYFMHYILLSIFYPVNRQYESVTNIVDPDIQKNRINGDSGGQGPAQHVFRETCLEI